MLKIRHCSIQDVQDEARALVTHGAVNRQNHIYELAKFFGYEEWPDVERLLEYHGYLLRDSVIDLIGQETWIND